MDECWISDFGCGSGGIPGIILDIRIGLVYFAYGSER